MAYVFRFHKGADTIDGWQETAQVGAKDIEAIDDPNGAKASLPITSIPTPFAGLELTKTAFAYCAQRGNVIGSTIYHKLVANALDVLEIFFGYKTKYEKYFQIVAWDKMNSLQQLASDGTPEHKAVAETLQLFLSQDAKAFHFEDMQQMYMLNFVGRGAVGQLNIVGATSPTSVTLASPNDLSYVKGVWLGNYHEAFQPDEDGSFRALCHRDRDFKLFVYLLAKQPGFNALYNEFYTYVDECFRMDDDTDFKNQVNAMPPAMYQSLYQPLTVGASQILLPGGWVLMTAKGNKIDQESDFRILAEDNATNEKIPLVLPEEPYFEKQMRYTTVDWMPRLCAPNADSRPMEERTLPFDSSPYPYLTADDLFQPALLKLPYPVNDKAFVNALYKDGRVANDACQYVLPLKPLIFKYLKVQTVMGYVGNSAEPVCELSDMADGTVRAILRIPVQKGRFITLRRDYTPLSSASLNNQGLYPVIEARVDLFLFPSFHILDAGVATPQRIYLVDEDTEGFRKEQYQYMVSPYKHLTDSPLSTVRVDRANKAEHFLSSRYFCLDEEYDYIVIGNGNEQGVLIPRFKEIKQGNKVFDFAVDFGTTNTHVEYRTNDDEMTRPLTVDHEQTQVLALNSLSDAAIRKMDEQGLESFYGGPTQAFMQEFLPLVIAQGEVARFPMRTNLCFREGHNVVGRDVLTLADYNVGFHYEKEDTYDYNNTRTDLKWADAKNDNMLVEAYFEELLLIIRNKVLMGGGALARTGITWFYPVCMQPYQIASLEGAWNKLSKKLIAPQGARLMKVPESLAPYYYYTMNEDVDAESRPVVSLDIGGGTTDFVVYHQGNKAVAISSVRFAGNSIYGDFLGRATEYNGFMRAFAPLFDNLLRDIAGVSDVYAKAKRSSAEFVSFLYSLDSNPRMVGKGVSFSEELRADQSMRVVLLLFYAAEIFYAAHLLKAKKLSSPAYVTVSGTASKVLTLIGGVEVLQNMARIIFNDILGDDGRVELKLVDNPKEITCKGGLNMRQRFVVDDVEGITLFQTGSATLDKVADPRYGDINDQVRSEVLEEYTRFVDYFFGLNGKYSFAKYFGIVNERDFNEFKNVLTEKAEQDFNKVVALRKENMANEENPEINDSLFFIPLTGGIARLAYHISTH